MLGERVEVALTNLCHTNVTLRACVNVTFRACHSGTSQHRLLCGVRDQPTCHQKSYLEPQLLQIHTEAPFSGKPVDTACRVVSSSATQPLSIRSNLQ